jgi:hypothetical protein
MPGNGYQGECGRWGWTQGEGHKKSNEGLLFLEKKKRKDLSSLLRSNAKVFCYFFKKAGLAYVPRFFRFCSSS